MTLDGWSSALTPSSDLRVSPLHAHTHYHGTVLFSASDKYPIRLVRFSALENSSSSSSSSSYVKKETTSDNDSSVNVNVWDSNAESVRGRWKSRTSSSSSSVKYQPGKDVQNAEDNWQWWYSGPDDDAYGGDEDDDEDVDGSFRSWLNIDDFEPLSVMSILKWMLPAAAIFLPWLFGGPMFFMAIFVFSPWIQKLAGALMPTFWNVLWQGLNSQARSKQKQGKRDKRSSVDEGSYNAFWRWMRQDQRGKYNDDDEWSTADEPVQLSKLGGWDDSDEDFLMLQRISRATNNLEVGRRRKRKEVPLLFRFVLAIFPFLRTWGGFL